MDLKEKVEKANSNILDLIEIVICSHKSEMNNYCVYPEQRHCGKSNCKKCKEEYFDKLEDEMTDKYLV